jgi:hypothetical protein
MSTDLHLLSQADPAVGAPSRAAVYQGRVEGAEPAADLTATQRLAWHAPQLTHIEIKRTMLGTSAGNDGEVSTALVDGLLPDKP